MLSALERIRLFLMPPGKGIYTPSTGGYYAEQLHEALYKTKNPKEVQAFFEDSLSKIRRVEKVILGVPSDTGAGILKGANFGPIGVRLAYLKRFLTYPKNLLDFGDVLCVPQLLEDGMLNEAQIEACRKVLYPNITEKLPVSPLSMTEAVLDALYELNPNIKVFIIGGDHSVSWPAMASTFKRQNDFAVLHFDAHTDLMENRLGIKYCFATWAQHTQKKLKPQHLVQVGIRTTKRSKEEWMRDYPVTQFWANEIIGHEQEYQEKILNHLFSLGVKKVYISNDIDGTDISYAFATGTPEANGLHPDFVLQLQDKIKESFELIGGDIVEVAPPLSGKRDFENDLTCQLAAEYLKSMIV